MLQTRPRGFETADQNSRTSQKRINIESTHDSDPYLKSALVLFIHLGIDSSSFDDLAIVMALTRESFSLAALPDISA